MPARDSRVPADIVIGRHPEFGITATVARDFPASAWVLDGFGFRAVPDHPDLYRMANPHPNAGLQATYTVILLRKAGYTVEADFTMSPTPQPRSEPLSNSRPDTEPHVAFAEHPRLGPVAATNTDGPGLGSRLLENHGWHHSPGLYVYVLPATTTRAESLALVAKTTLALQRAGLHVAVHPSLAQDVTDQNALAPTQVARQENRSVVGPTKAATDAPKAPAPAPFSPAPGRTPAKGL